MVKNLTARGVAGGEFHPPKTLLVARNEHEPKALWFLPGTASAPEHLLRLTDLKRRHAKLQIPNDDCASRRVHTGGEPRSGDQGLDRAFLEGVECATCPRGVAKVHADAC